MNKEKFFLRLFAIWLTAVVLSIAFGTTSSILGYQKIGAILGVVFISLFGGALLIVALGLCVLIWFLAGKDYV